MTPPTDTAAEPIKIFKLNDCDWFAARTMEEAIACARAEFDYGDDSIEDPHELTDEELDTHLFQFRNDYDRPLESMSFRAALAKRIADGERFPYLFASTEY